MMLEEVNATIKPIEGLQVFKNWVNSTQEFSNASLQREIDKNDNICLRKAISWSNNLNNAIEGLTDDEKKPFAGVKQTLESCHKLANIAIVSSANGGAVRDEWYKYGLAEHVDVILTQEMGDKAYCISAMQSKGYCKDKVLMVGDAVGDLKAAESSGVLFYPILVGKEEASWQNLLNEAVPKLVNGSFDKTYQKQLIERLYSNFHKN
jgi:phosphoglycolate phosphatase-like HAD superfamily hydrolase